MGEDGAQQTRAEMVFSSVVVDNEYVPYPVQNPSKISQRLFHQLYGVHIIQCMYMYIEYTTDTT